MAPSPSRLLTTARATSNAAKAVLTGAALVALLALTATATQPAQHHCVHDRIVSRQLRGRTLTEARSAGLLRSVASLKSPSRATARAGDAGDWAPIRIRVLTADLEDESRYCTEVGQIRPTYQGTNDTCKEGDILTPEKREILLNTMIPNAVKMHLDRLLVQPLANVSIGDAMDYQNGQNYYCNSFTVPQDILQSGGATDADFLIFAAAGVMPEEDQGVVAWATTCAVMDNLRPTIGVINVSPEYIDTSDQGERTVAHEMMHALGFSSDFFGELGLVANAAGLRGKETAPVLVGPNVIQRTGNQYGCDDVIGAEVDDSGGAGTYGSHWHYRNAKDEIMCGYVSPAMRYTALSMAAMEDLGFYRANYDKAEYMEWGFNASCTLLNDKCLVDAKTQIPETFCDTNQTLQCTADHLAVGTCLIRDYASDIPEWMQYFPGHPSRGGYRTPDYCPFYRDMPGQQCATGAQDSLPLSVISTDARCVNLAEGSTLTSPICVTTVCDADTQTYQIQVLGATSPVDCPVGSTIDAADSSSQFPAGSTIVCPLYRSVCPATFSSTDVVVHQRPIDNTTNSTGHGDGCATHASQFALAAMTLILLLSTAVIA